MAQEHPKTVDLRLGDRVACSCDYVLPRGATGRVTRFFDNDLVGIEFEAPTVSWVKVLKDGKRRSLPAGATLVVDCAALSPLAEASAVVA